VPDGAGDFLRSIHSDGAHAEEDTLEAKTDEHYMRLALEEARAAIPEGEVPVGCVIVHEGRVLARAHNLRETRNDPTAHAEMVAYARAGAELGTWHLDDTTVYCTVEPCCMCAGAAVNARVGRIVYGIADPKSGGCGSVFDIARAEGLNHRCEVTGRVLEQECLELLRGFFREKRAKRNGG
jgi:tRNA(adenine34) deaminase